MVLISDDGAALALLEGLIANDEARVDRLQRRLYEVVSDLRKADAELAYQRAHLSALKHKLGLAP